MKSGVVILNKGEGLTSQTAVNKIKRLFSADKAGHTGTLDPLAVGVLPILLGKGVKASEYMLSSDKHYIATLLLGTTTDTEDITGTVLTKSDFIPSEDAVISAVNSMLGKSMQIPPMYSALKVGGKKLCDLARDGITVEREAREITVYKIKAEKVNDIEYTLDIICSKGTYIRTLCKDIGEKLGCGGCMKTLMRASASSFTLADAHTIEEIEAMSEDERDALILPIERVFMKYEKVSLPPFFSKLAHSGLEIYLSKIGVSLAEGTRVRMCDENGFFAFGEVRMFDGGLAIKPIKQF